MNRIDKASSFIASVWNFSGSGYGALVVKTPVGKMETLYFQVPTNPKRIAQQLKLIPDNREIYFCPTPGTKKSRKKDSYDRIRLLWADLDEADPRKISPKPQIAWQTSPGRYQSLWLLEESLPASKVERVNKALSYSVGADKGGWDLGQILRVPYTYNNKPKYDKPLIPVLWQRREFVLPYQLPKTPKKLDAQPRENSVAEPPVRMSPALTQAWSNWESIPDGERSEWPMRWMGALLGKGISPEWAIKLIADHGLTQSRATNPLEEAERCYNKWEERGIRPKGDRKAVFEWEPNSFSLADKLHQTYTPDWLIEDVWLKKSCGILVGAPKSYKTWISFDLASSIASGTHFLDNKKFKSYGQKRVLIIQEEDGEHLVVSRFQRILAHKELGPKLLKSSKKRELRIDFTEKDLPIRCMCSSSFSLADDSCIAGLEDQLKDFAPDLVILDPLFMMLGDTEDNKIGAMSDLLRPLKPFRDKYGTSFIIVHHKRKKSKDSGSGWDEMYGSIALQAWMEGGIILDPVGDIDRDRTVSFKKRFKPAPSGKDFEVYFHEKMNDEYRPEIRKIGETAKVKKSKESEEKSEADYKRLIGFLKQDGEKYSERKLHEELGISKYRIGQAVEKAIEKGYVGLTAEKYPRIFYISE